MTVTVTVPATTVTLNLTTTTSSGPHRACDPASLKREGECGEKATERPTNYNTLPAQDPRNLPAAQLGNGLTSRLNRLELMMTLSLGLLV